MTHGTTTRRRFEHPNRGVSRFPVVALHRKLLQRQSSFAHQHLFRYFASEHSYFDVALRSTPVDVTCKRRGGKGTWLGQAPRPHPCVVLPSTKGMAVLRTGARPGRLFCYVASTTLTAVNDPLLLQEGCRSRSPQCFQQSVRGPLSTASPLASTCGEIFIFLPTCYVTTTKRLFDRTSSYQLVYDFNNRRPSYYVPLNIGVSVTAILQQYVVSPRCPTLGCTTHVQHVYVPVIGAGAYSTLTNRKMHPPTEDLKLRAQRRIARVCAVPPGCAGPPQQTWCRRRRLQSGTGLQRLQKYQPTKTGPP